MQRETNRQRETNMSQTLHGISNFTTKVTLVDNFNVDYDSYLIMIEYIT